ncbi:transcription factor VBP [Rhagoletis pomonella]|uniref:transcription factor VBP n=1 Tax=Rhagoletis pomonella TaxID=28610 RepID=UPI001785A116|nr:transcription factor VBP [Rhagoletis pomonella]
MDVHNHYNITKDINEPLAITHSGENSSSIPPKSPLLDISEPLSVADTTDSLDVETHIDKFDGNEQNAKTQSLLLKSTIENESSVITTKTTIPVNNATLPIQLPTTLGMTPINGTSFPTNKSTLPAFEYISPTNHSLNIADFPLMELNRVGVFPAFLHRRSRGEKRPIPEDQKDEKYYERRKRNNEAAKKSRDARKIREDRIAFRAALLEQENSILRAQVMALRDELQTIRRLISSNTTGTATPILGTNTRGLIAL